MEDFLSIFAPAKTKKGPFVYRLGRKIFILERGVRFSYGLPGVPTKGGAPFYDWKANKTGKANKKQE